MNNWFIKIQNLKNKKNKKKILNIFIFIFLNK